MGKIVYKPHCSKCGALIDEEISYTEDLGLFDSKISPKKMCTLW